MSAITMDHGQAATRAKVLVVWDFHGTLEQGTRYAVLEACNAVLAQHGHDERFSYDEADACFGLRLYKYFEYKLPDHDHTHHRHLQSKVYALCDGKDAFTRRWISPAEGAIEVVQTLQAQRYDQIIISDTIPCNLMNFIKSVGLQQFFGTHNAFGSAINALNTTSSKMSVLNDYLRNHSYDRILVVSDHARDMVLARRSGATGLFYDPDYRNTPMPLLDRLRSYRIHDLREILMHPAIIAGSNRTTTAKA